MLHESTINNLEGSGVSCTDKVGSGPDGCEQNVCAPLSGKNETFEISGVCGHQDIGMRSVQSFSGPRLKKNSHMNNKSVKTLMSFHSTSFVSGEGGSSRLGEIGKKMNSHTAKEKRVRRGQFR